MTGVRFGFGCATNVTVMSSAETPTTRPMSTFLITASLPRPGDLAAAGQSWFRQRPRYGVEQLRDQLKHRRHDHLGVEPRVDGALPEHAVADHREGTRDRRDVERRRNAALVLQLLEQLHEALVDLAVEALEDLGDARVA